MSNPSQQGHKIWIEWCDATERIRDFFGLQNALDYLVGEKLFSFIRYYPAYAAELPAFAEEIGNLFTAAELVAYLDQLQRKRLIARHEPEQPAPIVRRKFNRPELERLLRL